MRNTGFFSAMAQKARQDNAPFLARALAFDVLLCLIPATFLAFIVLGFLFQSPRETTKFMSTYMKAMIPFSSQQVLLNLFSIVKAQKLWGVLGFLGLLWTLSRVFGSVRTVLDVVFQVKKDRGFFRGKLFDLKMMLLSTALSSHHRPGHFDFFSPQKGRLSNPEHEIRVPREPGEN